MALAPGVGFNTATLAKLSPYLIGAGAGLLQGGPQGLGKGLLYGSELQQQAQANELARLLSARQEREIKLEEDKFAAGWGTDTPSNLKEWQAYQMMTPEQKREFLTMKRAITPIDLGDRVGVPNPVLPGTLSGEIDKGIAPELTSGHKAAVKRAETGAEIDTKRDIAMSGIGDIIGTARGVLSGKTRPTGSWVGKGVDIAGSVIGASPKGAAEADQLRAISGALVAKMPRMEGPQSEYDVALYKEMAGQIGDDTLPIERRLAALDAVDGLWAKYGSTAQTPSASQGATAPASGNGWSITREE